MSIKKSTRDASVATAEAWLETHGDYLYRYAKSRVFDHTAAEDLVQETLITALRRMDQFEQHSSVRTWLTGILKFKIREYARRKKRYPLLYDDGFDWAAPDDWYDAEGHWSAAAKGAGMDWSPDPRAELDQKEFWQVLQHCLSKLPTNAALAFMQRELEFASPQKIMKSLGVSQSNLWVLLHRARNQLKRCIQTNWLDHT